MKRLGHDLLRVFLPTFALWLAGLVWFVWSLPMQAEDSATPTDAIVVLTGGSMRLDEGMRLLNRGLAQSLFITGVGKGVTPADLFGERGSNPRIQLGYGADDTVGNAVEAVTMMTFHDYKSLRLVTSQYHMPRSLVEFQKRMPGITIIPHPVFNDSIHPDRWWLDPHTFRLIAGEYSKFLWSAWRSIL